MNDLLPDYLIDVDGQELLVSGARATESLLFVLRERLGVSSVKSGCEAGPFATESCTGACAVLVDGELRMACLTLAVAVSGRSVLTAAGVGRGRPSDVAEAMVWAGAVGSGEFLPGAVLAAHALLDVDPDPTDDAIRDALSGVVSRGGGYGRLMAGVRAAAAGRAAAQQQTDSAGWLDV